MLRLFSVMYIDIDYDMPPIYNETVANIQKNVYK